MAVKIKKVTIQGISREYSADERTSTVLVRTGDGSEGAQALLTVSPTEHPAFMSAGSEGITLTCEDGHIARLGDGGTVFAGRSAAEESLLVSAFGNVLSTAGSVVVLTNSRYSSSARCAAQAAATYGQPVRYISEGAATAGFYPLAGWTDSEVELYFNKYVAPAYIGHNAMPSDTVRLSIKALISLARRYPAFLGLMRDGAGSVNAVLEALEDAGVPEAEAERHASLFRGDPQACILAMQILGDYIRALGAVCTPAANGERYNLFSPGVTVIEINDQAAAIQSSRIWYLCRMAGMLGSVSGVRLTVAAEDISDDVLSSFSALLLNDNVDPFIVYGSFKAFLDCRIAMRLLARIDKQFVFTQNDAESAEYWSRLSGERKVLTGSYGSTQSVTHSFLQFPQRTRGSTRTYNEVYRPNLEVSHFLGLAPDEGELFENAGDFPFHHFSV